MTINLFFITVSIKQSIKSGEQHDRDLYVKQMMKKVKDRHIDVHYIV
ncbi:YrzI family small protein [Metabacillus sp. GX 13764]|nr:YrzI family small protein [Metabacillus kandeliae]MCD7033016.1 YrzI family small protein [Metabacillus kandeliae]